MKFRTENEFTHFKFSDVHVSDIMMSFGTFKICLDNVIIKACLLYTSPSPRDTR